MKNHKLTREFSRLSFSRLYLKGRQIFSFGAGVEALGRSGPPQAPAQG